MFILNLRENVCSEWTVGQKLLILLHFFSDLNMYIESWFYLWICKTWIYVSSHWIWHKTCFDIFSIFAVLFWLRIVFLRHSMVLGPLHLTTLVLYLVYELHTYNLSTEILPRQDYNRFNRLSMVKIYTSNIF